MEIKELLNKGNTKDVCAALELLGIEHEIQEASLYGVDEKVNCKNINTETMLMVKKYFDDDFIFFGKFSDKFDIFILHNNNELDIY